MSTWLWNNGTEIRKIRNDGYVYIDKTALIHKLVNSGSYYFLSRPRRFGKSLLISTLEAYFQGKRELFEGLAMEKLEKNWVKRPVLHLDLNIGKYDTPDSLDKILDNALSQWEAIYGTGIAETTLALRFKGILERAYKQTSERAGTALPERALHCLQTGRFLYPGKISYVRRTDWPRGKNYGLHLRDGVQTGRHRWRGHRPDRREALRPPLRDGFTEVVQDWNQFQQPDKEHREVDSEKQLNIFIKTQYEISFSYNLCTSSYGIKLGYWGIWFGAAGILASALFIYLAINSNVPDYLPMLIQMDSLNDKRGTQIDSLIKAGQNRTNGQIDSVKKQLDNIQIQSEKQLKAIESLKQKEDKQSQQNSEHSSANWKVRFPPSRYVKPKPQS